MGSAGNCPTAGGGTVGQPISGTERTRTTRETVPDGGGDQAARRNGRRAQRSAMGIAGAINCYASHAIDRRDTNSRRRIHEFVEGLADCLGLSPVLPRHPA
jgi:hypothetical protein